MRAVKDLSLAKKPPIIQPGTHLLSSRRIAK